MGIVSTLKNLYRVYQALKVADNRVDTSIFESMNTVAINDLLTGSGTSYYTNAYELCPAISTVVNKKIQAVVRAKVMCADVNGNVFDKPKGDFNKIMTLLEKPNNYQNYNQFIQTIDTFINIYGVCYVYKVKPVGLNKITGLIAIPNSCITVTYKTNVNTLANTNSIIDFYTITLFGESFILRSDEQKDFIFAINDIGVSCKNTDAFKPKSRIDGVKTNIENIVASVNARNTIITKRGAEGILSPEKSNDTATQSLGINEAERDRLQTEWRRYGLMGNQFNTLIAKIAMRYQPITKPVAELGLFDGENADYRTIAGVYGVPIPLLSLPDTTKYNTYLEAKTEFYEDTIIPETENIFQSLSILFGTKEQGFILKPSFEHLSIMQKSEKDKADMFVKMVDGLNSAVETGLMDINEAKELLNEYK